MEKAARSSKIPFTEISKLSGISHPYLYNLFEKEDLGDYYIDKIAKIINKDLSYLSSNLVGESGLSYESLLDVKKDDKVELSKVTDYWIAKPIKFMEKHLTLLKSVKVVKNK